MIKLKALLIDDDHNFCHTFQALAENTFDLKIAHSGKDGLKLLSKSTAQVVLLDLKLGRGMNGLEVLKKIKQTHPDLPVIMISDFADVPTAVEAMKIGALHYMSKSPNINEIKLLIEREMEQVNWKRLYQQYSSEQIDRFVAESPIMQPVLKKIQQISKTDATVLIEGQTGTGKEVTAREIHRQSRRSDKPFVAINCSSLTAHLFESEFFGHEKGAFTGADTQKLGKLELAHNGTILLDEIGDLPIESQAKILRAIEEKTFQRLGGIETITVDVRIIVASNKSLQQLVDENKFREDLFYRLSVVTIKLPPLRERKEDIPLLVELFLKRFAFEQDKNKPDISSKAIKKLQNYEWQGNIRELKNFIERLMVFHSDKHIIEEQDIGLISNDETFQFPHQLLELPYDQAKRKILNKFKLFYLGQALQKHNGSISATAREVGINRASLHKMLNELASE